MQKFLRTMMLVALMLVPFASRAQVLSADRQPLSEDFSAPATEWTGGTSVFGSAFVAADAPSWTYADLQINGLEAGHYYYTMWQARAAWMVTPELDLTELGVDTLFFDMAVTNQSGTAAPEAISADKKVMVLVSVDGGSWQPLRTWVGGTEAGEGQALLTSLGASYTHDTVVMNAYCGHTVRIAFYNEVSEARNEAITVHLDNVLMKGAIKTLPVTNLQAEAMGSSITITWVDDVNPLVAYYVVSLYNGETLVATQQVAMNLRIWSFENLESRTDYTVKVRTYADANTYSTDATLDVTTDFNYVDASNGYTVDFEGENPLADWTITASGIYTWGLGAIETETEEETTVNHVMWVIDTTTGENTYNTSGMRRFYAMLPLHLAAGTYDFQFDWNGKGEANYDYLKVFLVSDLNALGSSSDPAESLAVTGKLAMATEWTTFNGTLTAAESGNYFLAFMWRNDGSGGTQPPASFDNVSIAPWSCYPVSNLEVVDSATTYATLALSWESESEALSYVLRALAPGVDTIEAIVPAADLTMPYLLGTDLVANTAYMISVYTVCAEGDTSEAAVTVGATHQLCMPVEQIEAVASRAGAVINWVDRWNDNATYDVVVLQGTDTVANLAGVESGVQVAGLLPSTDYTVKVVAHCNEAEAIASATFTTSSILAGCSPEEKAITPNTGANSQFIPTASYYNYSITQILLTADEIDLDATTIEGIVLNVTGTMANRNFSIYMQNTDRTSISSAVAVSEDSKVFEGMFYPQSGNSPIAFNTPFVYDGTSNVLLTIDDNTGDYQNGMRFNGANVSSGKVVNAYSDGTDYDPIAANYSTSEQTFCPAINFTIDCPVAEAILVEVGERTQASAELSWNNPHAAIEEDAAEYRVVVKAGDVVAFEQTVEGTTVTATGLEPSTAYTATVIAVFADGLSYESAPVSFETYGPCNAPINFAATATRTTIALTWEQEVSTVDSYQLYVSTEAVEDLSTIDADQLIAVSGNEGYTLLNLDAATTYYLYFRAACGESTSLWRTADATTLPFQDCSVDATLADGTTTNYYVPLYMNYLDAVQHSQFIYTADMLEEYVGMNIQSVTFYVSSNSSWTWSKQALAISLGTTDATEFSSNSYLDSPDVVVCAATGVSAQNGTVTFTFDQPYQYNGGNLLFDFNVTQTGNYSNFSFYGINKTNASIHQYISYGSPSLSRYSFLPKIKLNGCVEVPPACDPVSNLTVNDIDYNAANISWERPDCKVVSYLLVHSTAELDEAALAAATPVELAATATTYALQGIEQNAMHYVYMATICGEAEGDTTWTSVSFETPAYCRVATNLAAEVNGKNSALVSWESTNEEQEANFSLIVSTEALTDDQLASTTATYTGVHALSYQLSNLLYEQNYFVYVRNVCALDDAEAPAPWFGPVSFTTGVEMPAVVDLTAQVYRNQITATWKSDTANYADETLWRVAIAAHEAEVEADAWQTVGVREAVFGDLEYATAYDIYVVAINGTSTSDTVVATATTGLNMPAVVNVRTIEKSYNYAVVAWDRNEAANATETAWRVAFFAADESVIVDWATVETAEQTYLNLEPSTTYKVRVLAYNAEADVVSDTVSFSFATNALPENCGEAIADGNTTSSVVPLEMNWLDTKQRSQFIYSADMLEEYVGKSILSMTFYVNSNASWTWRKTYSSSSNIMEALTISVGTTVATEFGINAYLEDADVVVCAATGVSAENGTVTFTFDQPYQYNGGNLIFDFNVTETGYYKSMSYYGFNKSNASVRNRNTDTPELQSFLPKVKFCYEDNGSLYPVQHIAVSDITTTTAVASWKPGLDETSWQYVNSQVALNNNALAEAELVTVSSTTVELTGLTRDADYYLYVRAVGEDEEGEAVYSDWRSATYTTLYDCGVPTVMPAEEITDGSAVLVASASEEGAPASINFRYWREGEQAENGTTVSAATADEDGLYKVEVEGLLSGSIYHVQAQTVCAEAEGTSRWSSDITFATLCNGIVTLPYTEDFGSNSVNADCWTIIVNDSLVGEALVSNGELEFDDYTYALNGHDRYAVSPVFEATDSVRLSFEYFNYNSSYNSITGSIGIGYTTTDGEFDLEDVVWFDTVNGSTYSQTVVTYMPAVARRVVYHSMGSAYYVPYIDDVNIRVLNKYSIAAAVDGDNGDTIRFIVDGNTEPAALSYSGQYYEPVTIRLIPAAGAHRHFVCWTNANTGDTLSTTAMMTLGSPLSRDTNVVAHFALDNYTLNVAINAANRGRAYIGEPVVEEVEGETVTTYSTTATAAYGTEYTIHAVDTAANDGYHFAGWSTSANINNIVSMDADYTFVPEANTTLTAMFTIDSFYVSVNYNDEMGVVTGQGAYATNNNNIHMTAEPTYGHEFVKWVMADETELTEPTFDTVITSDVEFTAQFQTIPFYLMVASNNEQLGTAEASADHGQYMDEIILTATATAEHYHFERWSDNTTENPYIFHITQDTVMTAFFAIDQHELTLLASADDEENAQGTVEGAGTYAYGTEVEIEAVPSIGMEFVQWSDNNTDNPRTYTVLNDATLTALFDSITYQVAINYVATEGNVYGNDDEVITPGTIVEKHYGNEIFVSAEPSTGFVFSAWQDAEGNLYNEAELTYTVTDQAEQSLTALFAETGKVNMNLAAVPAEGGAVAGIGTYNGVEMTYPEQVRYDSDGEFTMTATAAEHYHFLNWTSGDTVFSTEPEATIQLNEEMDALYFTANFALDTHTVFAVANNDEMGSFTFDGEAATSMEVEYGQEVVVNAVAAPYHHFNGWLNAEGEIVRTEADTTVTMGDEDITLNAEFAVNTYAVSIAANDETFGTVTINDEAVEFGVELQYPYGTELTIAAIPTTGYHVTSWSNGSTTATITATVMGDMPLTVSFDTNIYTVTLAANEAVRGTVEGAGQVKHFASTLVNAEANYGYHFTAWVNAEGETVSEEASFEVHPVSDTTLTAVFDKNLYHVVVALVDGVDETMGSVTAIDADTAYLSQIALTATAATGHHVTGWFDAAGNRLKTGTYNNNKSTDTYTFTVVRDTNVYAGFAINRYRVRAQVSSANSSRGTASTNAVNDSAAYGQTVTYTAVANEGFEFTGWRKGSSATATLVSTEAVFDTAITANLDLYANFAVLTLDMTVAVNDETMGTATVSSASVNYNASVTFTATANTGYHFVSWTNADGEVVSTEATYTTNATADMTLTAVFAINNYAVAATANDATMGSATVSAATADHGTEVTFTATAATGYHFVGWTDAEGETVSTEATYTATVTADLTLTAVFAINNYAVAATANDATMGTATVSAATADHGTTVTFTATANDGYQFVNWTNAAGTAVSTEATLTVTVVSDTTLTANFEAVAAANFTLTLAINDATMGSVTGEGQYEAGTTVTITATANDGYEFVSWTDEDGNVVSTEAIYVVTIEADMTLTANFRENVGIDDVEATAVNIYANGNRIVVRGAMNQTVYVFDVNGRVMNHETSAAEESVFTMPGTGVYLVKVGNLPAKRVVIVR